MYSFLPAIRFQPAFSGHQKEKSASSATSSRTAQHEAPQDTAVFKVTLQDMLREEALYNAKIALQAVRALHTDLNTPELYQLERSLTARHSLLAQKIEDENSSLPPAYQKTLAGEPEYEKGYAKSILLSRQTPSLPSKMGDIMALDKKLNNVAYNAGLVPKEAIDPDVSYYRLKKDWDTAMMEPTDATEHIVDLINALIDARCTLLKE